MEYLTIILKLSLEEAEAIIEAAGDQLKIINDDASEEEAKRLAEEEATKAATA